ncbi:MAG: hypothetical protein QM478_08730 [Flavobacteriaceae bacterium]
MRTKLLLLTAIFLLSSAIYSQEIGSVKNGEHSISLIKTNDKFSCLYSDVNTNILFPKRSFVFPNKETIYAIIKGGFQNESNHQVYVQMNKYTIVKFEYKKMNGKMVVKIIHNNLANSKIGNTVFLTPFQIDKLFGKKTETKV